MAKFTMNPPETLSIIFSGNWDGNALLYAMQKLASPQDIRLEAILPCDMVNLKETIASFWKYGEPLFFQAGENSGLLSSLLKGMKIASGSYLTFLEPGLELSDPCAYMNVFLQGSSELPDIIHFNTEIPNKWGLYSFAEYLAPFSLARLDGEKIFSEWISSGCRDHVLWNKFYSRGLYQKVARISHELKLNELAGLYLSAYFFMFADSYSPARDIVYKFTPDPAIPFQHFIQRALDCLRIYLHFSEISPPLNMMAEHREKFKDVLLSQLTLNMTEVNRSIFPASNGPFDEEKFNQLTRYGSEEEIFLALALANGFNGNKIKEIAQIIRWSW